MRLIDRIGTTINSFTILDQGSKKGKVKIKCNYCGAVFERYLYKLYTVKDRGHCNHITSKGWKSSKLYAAYKHMIDRCYNSKNERYNIYGARGITVCKEWLEDPLTFQEWAYQNGFTDQQQDVRKHSLSIDRIDGSGNYEPSNCQWITVSENSKKASQDHKCIFVTVNNITKNLKEWDVYCHVSKGHFRSVYKRKGIQAVKEQITSALLGELSIRENRETVFVTSHGITKSMISWDKHMKKYNGYCSRVYRSKGLQVLQHIIDNFINNERDEE